MWEYTDDVIERMADPNNLPPGFIEQQKERQQQIQDATTKVHSWGKSYGFWKSRRGMDLAYLPTELYFALLKRYGVEWLRSVEYLKWLDRHPWFKTGSVTLLR